MSLLVRKMRKILWICAMLCCSILVSVACDDTPTEYVHNPLAFKEGAQTEFVYGDELVVGEVVDTKLGGTYTLKAVCGDEEYEISEYFAWMFPTPGTYVLHLHHTLGNESWTGTHTVYVEAIEIEFAYDDIVPIYQLNTVVDFSELIATFNIEVVKCFYGYEPIIYVKMIEVDAQRIDVSDQTEFLLTSTSEHYFTFGITTKEDGAEKVLRRKVAVQYIDPDAQEWLDENDMEAYQHTTIVKADNGTGYEVTLNPSTAIGNEWVSTDTPYLAMTGDFGVNNFISVDFVGDNMPYLSFFQKDLSANLTDGGDGIVLANGFFNAAGVPMIGITNYRYSVFGSRKLVNKVVHTYDRLLTSGEMVDTSSGEDVYPMPCPLSVNGLQADTSYRYIVGFTDAVTKVPGTESSEENNGSVNLHVRLINLDTGSVAFDTVYALKAGVKSTNPGGKLNSFDEGYFGGNILLMGRVSKKTKFTIHHGVYSDVTSASQIDLQASFLGGIANYVERGQTLKVADYIDVTKENCKLSYRENGSKDAPTQITSPVFTFTSVGEYQLIFEHEGVRPAVSWLKVVEDASVYDKYLFTGENSDQIHQATVGATSLAWGTGVTLSQSLLPNEAGQNGYAMHFYGTSREPIMHTVAAKKDASKYDYVEIKIYVEQWVGLINKGDMVDDLKFSLLDSNGKVSFSTRISHVTSDLSPADTSTPEKALTTRSGWVTVRINAPGTGFSNDIAGFILGVVLDAVTPRIIDMYVTEITFGND